MSLPKATVQKIVSEILPPSTGVSFSKEARDVLIECCVEFITLISSEANDISEKEAKKTIACDHITKALETLGFGDYVAAVVEAATTHKETQKVRDALPLAPCPLPRLHCMGRQQVTLITRSLALQVREKRGNKFEESGMSIEELQRLQEEQFAAARERHN